MSPTESPLQAARQALQVQDWSAAQAGFETVLKALPQDLEALCGMATVALGQQQFERAVALGRQAVAAWPASAAAHYGLALAFFQVGQLEEALTHLRQTTALEPEHGLAWIRLGQIYTRHGLPFYGFSCLERAQQVWPEQVVDPRSLSQAAWQAGLWGPFQHWIDRFFNQIPDLSLRLGIYTRWLDLLGYQAHCLDADWVAYLAQWERLLPSRLSLLPPQAVSLPRDKVPLRVACLCHSEAISRALLSPLSAYPIELRFFSPMAESEPSLLPALQAWQPDLILDQAGLSWPELLTWPRQLPQSVWLSGTDPDYPSPGLSGVTACDWPWFWPVPDGEAAPLPLPDGAPVAGYMGPIRALSEDTLQLWGDLLLAQPQLRLCLFSPEIDDPLLKQYLEQIFQSRGISGYRLRLLGNCASQEPLSFFFGQVHLVLAPHPRSSWFQTCQALWQGRPVICLNDARWQARNGAAKVLASLEWEPGLAQTSEEWCDKASALLAQPPEPAHLRDLLVSAEARQKGQLIQVWSQCLSQLGWQYAA